ncbi:DUF6207 family protein [Streptomyces neyagawaensis]|uniref:DUF6207 family protein n=1 Tax=Streptomyces neyagawaensis TaxID=42238 RepID=A0ABV3BCP8_9ACTN
MAVPALPHLQHPAARRPHPRRGPGRRRRRHRARLPAALADRWATATAQHTTRAAGEPGVRLRCYLDLRQELTAPAVVGPPLEPTTARP